MVECSFNAPGCACPPGFVQLVCRWSAGGGRARSQCGRARCFSSWTQSTESGPHKSLVSGRLSSAVVLDGGLTMIQVSIPSMEREVDEAGKTKKVRAALRLARCQHSLSSCTASQTHFSSGNFFPPFCPAYACSQLESGEARRQVSRATCRKSSSRFCPAMQEFCVFTLHCRKSVGKG